MTLPKAVDLVCAPANATNLASQGLIAVAQIVELTDGVVAQAMGDAWWVDKRLNRSAALGEIDRHWDWYAQSTNYLGRDLALDRFAILTDDGAVQGAMSVTADGVLMDGPTELGRPCLFVERLVTTPRNRPGVIAKPS